MTTLAWPAALAGTPAISVIERAIERQRLSHSLLLHGDDYEMLSAIALALADRVLSAPPAAPTPHFAPEQHPDCFFLRPVGKARMIRAEDTRALITKLQVTPAVAPRKVAIVHECDRMNRDSANIFLKTLEEPPRHTTLLLLTTRPYALLPTIRSRVLQFRFPTGAGTIAAAGWDAWIADYQAWLGRLADASTEKVAIADHIVTLYGLVSRFSFILAAATDEAWKLQKDKLPEDLDDDEQVAIETGLANGIRLRLFSAIERATRDFALPALTQDNPLPTGRALVAAVRQLEHDAGLLRLNLNEAAVLENFLLSSLRLWSRR